MKEESKVNKSKCYFIYILRGAHMNLFDIVGPVMVGPSSSHTAGAVKIGYVSIPIQKFNIEKKKKPDKRKKKKLRVKFKGFHIKKLIEYKILLEINLPEYLNGIIEELKFKFLPLSYMLRLMPELNIDCNSTFNTQNFIYFQK